MLIQNAPEKNTVIQHQSPLPFRQNSVPSGSILVTTAPINLEHNEQRQQSQIIANIENSMNYELDDDGFSQISFKHRQDEGNSSRGSLHNVYDNTSISTTNTSARTKDLADTDSNFLKMMTSGLQEVQESEDIETRSNAKIQTSMFIENSDILCYKLYYQKSILPVTNSRSIDDFKQRNTRRYSLGETKMFPNGNIHFENEILVKTCQSEKQENFDMIFDQLEMSIQNILELDKKQLVNHQTDYEKDDISDFSKANGSKRAIFQSLPNLDVS